MEKRFVLTVLAAMMLLSACVKEKEKAGVAQLSPNRLIYVTSDGGNRAPASLFVVQIGHRSSECNGCILDDGRLIHIDCMGMGDYCAKATSVYLEQDGTEVTAITTDTFGLTSEDFFLMPNRSLSYTDANNNRIYLNIPEQLVFRDTVTLQFTFTGLFFSDAPEYTND